MDIYLYIPSPFYPMFRVPLNAIIITNNHRTHINPCICHHYHRENRKEKTTQIIGPDDPIPERPKGNKGDYFKDANRRDVKTEGVLLGVLKRLFEIRPMWTKQKLMTNSLLGQRYNFLLSSLPYEAFAYNKGANKDLWVRWGYNSKVEKKASFYQMVHMRLPRDTWERLNKKLKTYVEDLPQYQSMTVCLDSLRVLPIKSKHEGWKHSRVNQGVNYIPFSVFGTAVKGRQLSFQMCNGMSADEEMFEFIKTAEIGSAWNDATGWYSEATMKLIRQKATETIFRKVAQLASKPLEATVSEPNQEQPSLTNETCAYASASPEGRKVAQMDATIGKCRQHMYQLLRR